MMTDAIPPSSLGGMRIKVKGSAHKSAVGLGGGRNASGSGNAGTSSSTGSTSSHQITTKKHRRRLEPLVSHGTTNFSLLAPSRPLTSLLSTSLKRSASPFRGSPFSTPSHSLESSPEPSTSNYASDSSATGASSSTDAGAKVKKVKSKHTPEGIERRLQAELSSSNRKKDELEKVRGIYQAARDRKGKGKGAAFLALDVETFEFQHSALLEFGWSFVEFSGDGGGEIQLAQVRREDQHVIVKEHLRKRNGKYSPDARDHFDFGTSVILPQETLFFVLLNLFESLSSSTNSPLYLIFHDKRSDLISLKGLGFDTSEWGHGLDGKERTSGVVVLDTQDLYAAWEGRKGQTKLEKCCSVLQVPTRRLHNAGNDAKYTLDIFERLMDRSRVPPRL